jgi:hypothetical protein
MDDRVCGKTGRPLLEEGKAAELTKVEAKTAGEEITMADTEVLEALEQAFRYCDERIS